MKILVRAPNWVGDAVLSLPALHSLKRNYPEAEIWIAAKDWVRDLFSGESEITGSLPLPQADGWRGLLLSAREVKSCSFDLGLLLSNSFASAFHFFLSGLPERWGYATDGRRALLTKWVRLRDEAPRPHQVHYYLNLLSGLGLQTHPPEMKLTLQDVDVEQGRAALNSRGLDPDMPLVILNPGAAYGPAKRWPADRFGRLAALLQQEKNVQVAVIGSAEEKQIAEALSASLQKKPVVFSGETTLRELLGLISRASLFITNDSGPMHMANALRVPLIAIFGPTDPAVTGPFHQPSAVITKSPPCGPCSYRKCPYNHECLTAIRPEEVFEAASIFLR